jgi:hypothetical protein
LSSGGSRETRVAQNNTTAGPKHPRELAGGGALVRESAEGAFADDGNEAPVHKRWAPNTASRRGMPAPTPIGPVVDPGKA